MGRQINFYMSEKVEKSFVELLNSNNYTIMWHDFAQNSIAVLNDYKCSELKQKNGILYLYKKMYGEYFIKKSNWIRIDASNSPIIEYIRTTIKNDDKKISRGRLWVETKYYNSNDELVEKSPNLVKDFVDLTKWIKKNIPYQEIEEGDSFVKEYICDEIIELVHQGYRLSL